MTVAQVAVNHKAIAEAADQLTRTVLDKIEFDQSGCWLWTATLDHTGYGRYREHRLAPSQAAHRYVYLALRGDFPQELDLDHLCRVRHCVNPYHLEPVTRRVNVLRGISPSAMNAVKTNCPEGHPYDDENTSVWNGGRKCKVCARLQARERRARRAANRPPRELVTHCYLGHPYSGANLHITSAGNRVCLACRTRLRLARIDRIGIDEARRQYRESTRRRKGQA